MMSWSEFRTLFVGALRLETPVFEHMRDAADGVGRGLVFLVIIGLVAGLIPGAVDFARTATGDPAAEVEEVRSVMDQIFGQMEQMGVFADDPEAGEMVRRNIDAGMSMGIRIAESIGESTPAPYAAVLLLQQLSSVVSGVFSWIGLWLLWGVLTLIVARLFGGVATIREMLGATSLVAAPHILGVVSFVPCAGALIQMLAFLWGLVVYIKAVAVSNRIDATRATLAVFMPLMIVTVLVLAFVSLLVLLIAVSN